MLPAFVLCATFLAQFTQSEAKGTLVLQRFYSTFNPPPFNHFFHQKSDPRNGASQEKSK